MNILPHERRSQYSVCFFSRLASFSWHLTSFHLFLLPTAIVAFLLLFATFAVGLRCFADFDKGLLSSKLHGQSYSPVATGFSKADLFGDYFYFPSHIPLFSSAVTGSKTSYSSPLPSPGEHTNSSNMRQSSYNAGSQLGPRISIEWRNHLDIEQHSIFFSSFLTLDIPSTWSSEHEDTPQGTPTSPDSSSASSKLVSVK